MSYRFQNRVAVVTGGAKGIGLAIAQAFHEAGANVVILDLDEGTSNAAFIRCDVSDADAVKQAFDQIQQRFTTIHYLINNAAIQHYGNVTDTDIDEWDRVLNINLKSAFLCAKHAIPLMKKGVVINMSSTAAFQTQKNTAPYSTAKTALLGLTRSIAIDYAPDIRCVAVCPGTIDTPMLHNALQQSKNPQKVLQECKDMHLAQRIGQPDEVANLVLYLCSDQADFITGQYYRIDGGQGISIPGSREI